jgi:hypothetical protein
VSFTSYGSGSGSGPRLGPRPGPRPGLRPSSDPVNKLRVSYLFVILEELLVFCFAIDGDQSTSGDVDQLVSVDRISWLVRRLTDGVVILF